jgi:hypothetical protein
MAYPVRRRTADSPPNRPLTVRGLHLLSGYSGDRVLPFDADRLPPTSIRGPLDAQAASRPHDVANPYEAAWDVEYQIPRSEPGLAVVERVALVLQRFPRPRVAGPILPAQRAVTVGFARE